MDGMAGQNKTTYLFDLQPFVAGGPKFESYTPIAM